MRAVTTTAGLRHSVAFLITATSLGSSAHAENVHFTYLWHLEQPIYWPARQAAGTDRYERAWESIQRKDGGAAHPADDLRGIFSLADRVAAYQNRPRDAVNLIRGTAEAGVQVSFSGGLIENISSLGNANQLGYSPGWFNPFREARAWTTVGGRPRMDVVLFSFHHALLPLCDENTVRKELQLYKQIYASTWGTTPLMSRGMFPSEMAFSERLIRPLTQEGVAWVVVSNEHLSRACTNFPLVLGSGGVNCEPPNRADAINSAQSDWLRTSISRGCAPANAVPFAYTPHYARQIDPDTGAEYKLIVIPADQGLGWKDGYSPLGVSEFAPLAAANPAARPQLVLLAHDGDNAWGGGYSYYMEAVPQFVQNAAAAGYVATTVEQYLANHPVPTSDVVHVEDGAWVNADGDFGSPTFLNWNWPLLNASGQVDIAGGWHVDERNWAVITAAQNRIDTAEQIACCGSNPCGTAAPGCLNIARILSPDAATTPAEHAWHYFLAGLNSGFMYYGTPLDMEVKPTIACNLATGYADTVIGNASQDATPPTVWIPQRFPYNPGSVNFGPAHGYQQVQNNGDFWIWTFAYDVSGLASVALKYRLDADTNVTDANRTYAGGAGVGAWQSAAMTRRAFPAGNVYNDPSIDFYVLPAYTADEYVLQLTGLRDTLIDYYVEAADTRGHVRRSPIQHVYIGPGSTTPPSTRVTLSPTPLVAGQPATIGYDATGGPLASAATVKAHVGYNQWAIVLPSDLTMTFNSATSRWEAALAAIDPAATQIDLAFNNGAGTWDNNGGQDWHAAVTGTQQPPATWTIDGQLDLAATLIAQNGASRLHAGVRGNKLYVAAPSASGDTRDHFVFVAATPGALRAAPWAKAGQVAGWTAYLANESSNNWCGWFDQGVAVGVQNAAGSTTGVLEGTIDLVQQFGAMPDAVYLAFAPYGTADGGALAAASQCPASLDGNGHLDAAEYIRVETVRRGDLTGDWQVTPADLPGFVAVLLGQDADARHIRAADVNSDNRADGADIASFVAAITSP